MSQRNIDPWEFCTLTGVFFYADPAPGTLLGLSRKAVQDAKLGASAKISDTKGGLERCKKSYYSGFSMKSKSCACHQGASPK